MGDIVNLRLARKRKARQATEEKAEENRRLHGRTKSDREQEQAERVNRDAFLDGHRLDRPDRNSE
ncbi:MAG: DUF4169 family protein [Rhizobiaceae bacterium]|jgi:hypothetical protein|nr:MAG: DUF4169 family protein [Rhizobiaceae bacterium]